MDEHEADGWQSLYCQSETLFRSAESRRASWIRLATIMLSTASKEKGDGGCTRITFSSKSPATQPSDLLQTMSTTATTVLLMEVGRRAVPSPYLSVGTHTYHEARHRVEGGVVDVGRRVNGSRGCDVHHLTDRQRLRLKVGHAGRAMRQERAKRGARMSPMTRAPHSYRGRRSERRSPKRKRANALSAGH